MSDISTIPEEEGEEEEGEEGEEEEETVWAQRDLSLSHVLLPSLLRHHRGGYASSTAFLG